MPARVLVVDPDRQRQKVLRDALERVPEVEDVRVRRRHPAAALQVAVDPPHVVVVTIDDDRAVELCRRLRSWFPDLKCLVVSALDEEDALLDALLVGAEDYLTLGQLERDEASVGTSLGGVVDGGRRVRRKAEAHARSGSSQGDPLDGLTDRQRKVAELVAQGLTNAEIAEELHLSANTVRNYLARVMTRLGTRNRTEVALAVARLAAEAPARPAVHPSEPVWKRSPRSGEARPPHVSRAPKPRRGP
jgi:two-component system response regulator DevR